MHEALDVQIAYTNKIVSNLSFKFNPLFLKHSINSKEVDNNGSDILYHKLITLQIIRLL